MLIDFLLFYLKNISNVDRFVDQILKPKWIKTGLGTFYEIYFVYL